VTNAIT